MEKEFESFMISQCAIIIKDGKFLIVEFSNKKGKWGLPGGRIDKEEMAEEAFHRELKEELGFEKIEILGVADYDIYYYNRSSNGDRIAKCNILNLIISDSEEILLSSEHSQYKWITPEEITNYDFVWPNMERMINKGFKMYELLKYEK